MKDRRTARRYDVSLPVIVGVPIRKQVVSRTGKIRDISAKGVYFTVDMDLSAGALLDLTMTVPAEVTGGTEVFVRATGNVVRVDKRPADANPRVGVAAVTERYEMVRNKSSIV
jgi:hypothetical protein